MKAVAKQNSREESKSALKQVRLGGKQQGSFYSTAIIVILFGVFLTAALKIAPTYMDNGVVKNAMEGVIANNDMAELSLNEIRTEVMRTLNTNRVDFDANNIVITRVGGSDYIDINYEARVPLFYNISAVVAFQNRFDKK